MPPTVREAQKTFTVAWHGFTLLGLLFVLMFALTYQGLSRWSAIQALEKSNQDSERRIAAMHAELSRLGMVQEQMVNYQTNLRFLDSLIVDPGKWSRLLSKLSQDFQSVNRVWIDEVISNPGGFTLVGKSQTRDRVPQLAARLPEVNLKRVSRVVSEAGEITYQFEVTAMIPQPSAAEIDSLRRAAPPLLRSESASTGIAGATEAALTTPEAPPAPDRAGEQPPAVQTTTALQE
jgi:hypothetical protein